MNNTSFTCRQGCVTKDVGENLKKGQIVQIVSEETNHFLVRRCYASPAQKVDKKNINLK